MPSIIRIVTAECDYEKEGRTICDCHCHHPIANPAEPSFDVENIHVECQYGEFCEHYPQEVDHILCKLKLSQCEPTIVKGGIDTYVMGSDDMLGIEVPDVDPDAVNINHWKNP